MAPQCTVQLALTVRTTLSSDGNTLLCIAAWNGSSGERANEYSELQCLQWLPPLAALLMKPLAARYDL